MNIIASLIKLRINRVALLVAVAPLVLFACQNNEPVADVESIPQVNSESSIIVAANTEELKRDFDLVFSSDMSTKDFAERVEFARRVGEQNNVDALLVGTPTEMPDVGAFRFEGKEQMKLGWVLGVRFVD